MTLRKLAFPIAAVMACGAFLTGCEKQAETPKKPKSETPAAKPATPAPTAPAPTSPTPAAPVPAPHAQPPAGAAPKDGATAPAAGSTLELDGLTFTIPEGWQSADPGTGMFVAKAAFSLTKAEGDAEDVSVRITHYPEQKGKDDMNVARWFAQVRRPDGSAYTKENADVKVTESGNIRLTVVDLPGSISTNMMGGGEAKPNQRMIAAIIDHPKGPHMIKAVGGAASIAKWEASIDTFIKGATAK